VHALKGFVSLVKLAPETRQSLSKFLHERMQYRFTANPTALPKCKANLTGTCPQKEDSKMVKRIRSKAPKQYFVVNANGDKVEVDKEDYIWHNNEKKAKEEQLSKEAFVRHFEFEGELPEPVIVKKKKPNREEILKQNEQNAVIFDNLFDVKKGAA
jgi:hypothetical protein